MLLGTAILDPEHSPDSDILKTDLVAPPSLSVYIFLNSRKVSVTCLEEGKGGLDGQCLSRKQKGELTAPPEFGYGKQVLAFYPRFIRISHGFLIRVYFLFDRSFSLLTFRTFGFDVRCLISLAIMNGLNY